MALLGTVLLWVFAIFGGVMAVLLIIGVYAPDQAKVEPPKPQPQIVNLRPVPKPEPAEAQILQKTTMQITTTKYTDPNAVQKELSA